MFSVYVSPVEAVNVQDVVTKVLLFFFPLCPFLSLCLSSFEDYGRLVPRSLKEDTNASCVQTGGQSTESPLPVAGKSGHVSLGGCRNPPD